MGDAAEAEEYFLAEYNYEAYQHTADSGESRQLAVVHKDRLREDLTKDNVEHGATGKTKAHSEAHSTDITDEVT